MHIEIARILYEFSLPSVRGDLQRSDLVVEESPHGEPVERLIASPADAAVVHISGHCHTQPLLAAPEENAITLTRSYIMYIANAGTSVLRLYLLSLREVRREKISAAG